VSKKENAVPPLLTVAVFNLDDKFVDQVRRAAGDSWKVFHARSADEVKERLGETEIMYGHRLDDEMLARADRLKWVQATGAGIERALTPAFVDSGVILTNASGIHEVQMSEHALGMMIALARRFVHYMRNQIKKNWDKSLGSSDIDELFEKKLAVVGLGSIGEALAVRAKAFGMHVTGVKRNPSGYDGAADEVVGAGALERVMSEADYVVNLLPLTPETEGLISAELIAAMKVTAYFVNLGRGATVDQEALTDALLSGAIAGAGLDVFEEEPLPKRSKLWKLPNVIITPHVSGLSPRYWERATDLFCENLRRYRAGEKLLNLVDKKLGY